MSYTKARGGATSCFFSSGGKKALMSSEKAGNGVTMSYTKAIGGVSTSSEFTFIVKVKAGAGVITSLAKRWDSRPL